MEQIRTTIRMPASLLKAIEKVRNPEEFPTVSDFIRRAVEQFAREQRRQKLVEECRRLAGEEDLTPLDLPVPHPYPPGFLNGSLQALPHPGAFSL